MNDSNNSLINLALISLSVAVLILYFQIVILEKEIKDIKEKKIVCEVEKDVK